MTWILVVAMLAGGHRPTRVPGFASLRDCADAGVARLLEAHESGRAASYRCVQDAAPTK